MDRDDLVVLDREVVPRALEVRDLQHCCCIASFHYVMMVQHYVPLPCETRARGARSASARERERGGATAARRGVVARARRDDDAATPLGRGEEEEEEEEEAAAAAAAAEEEEEEVEKRPQPCNGRACMNMPETMHLRMLT